MLGAAATAIVQSSSAVTSLTASLVDTGAMSFQSSLGVLLGANAGTALNGMAGLTQVDIDWPLLHSSGRSAERTPDPVQDGGEGGFLFCFIFFSLDVVSFTMKPLAHSPIFTEMLSRSSGPLMGALAGMLITAIVQSSSITTGLSIPLVQQSLMPATAAIPIVIGANIGTTVTALGASTKMHKTARSVAVANLCFNAFGVLLFLPFLGSFAEKAVEWAANPGMAAAWAQLIFNLVMVLAVLLLLRIFCGRLESLSTSASHAAAA